MSNPDVDEVIHYLSTRFNKIFCEREFVCCVTEDFQTILKNKNKCLVLLFPALGPTYLKAVRYQAKIFDLAVFNVSARNFKSVAVCHRNHLLRKNNEVREEVMADTSRRRRPERQLYVPPAQRSRGGVATSIPEKYGKAQKVQCNDDSNNGSGKQMFKSQDVMVVSAKKENLHMSLHSALFMFYNLLPQYPSRYDVPECQNRDLHNGYGFHKLLSLLNLKSKLYISSIPLYNNNNNQCLSPIEFIQYKKYSDSKTYPLFNWKLSQMETAVKPSAVLLSSDYQIDWDTLDSSNNLMNKAVCDIKCDVHDSDVIDLSSINMGHYCIIPIDESEYIYECQEEHDLVTCCIKKSTEIRNAKLNCQTPLQKVVANSSRQKTRVCEKKAVANNVIRTEHLNKKNEKGPSKNEHDQEKEIMRKTKENINRKTRPIMKYVDDTNDTLKIDKSDSVNNWEDLFDDDGSIQEELFTEIADKVGTDMTIVKANEDYTAYTNKPIEDLEHVVELYNFPSTLETHDLIQAFSDINSDAMYVKWVDDTHALLVLGSLTQAQKAVNMNNALIKARPMNAASAISRDVANKSDLKPAMKRPPTNLQTARRLITSHLGAKSRLTKEQIAKEKQDLKDAKEMRRLIKQNERDAWEGNLRSTVNQ